MKVTANELGVTRCNFNNYTRSFCCNKDVTVKGKNAFHKNITTCSQNHVACIKASFSSDCWVPVYNDKVCQVQHTQSSSTEKAHSWKHSGIEPICKDPMTVNKIN